MTDPSRIASNWGQQYCRLRLKCDGARAETRFRLSAKRTSPFKSARASVQSTTTNRGVRISGSNAGYTMFRGSVKSTDYPLQLASFPFTSPSLRHHEPSHFKWTLPRCSTTTGVATRGNRQNRVVCFKLWSGFALRGRLSRPHRQSGCLFSFLWGTARSNIVCSFPIVPINRPQRLLHSRRRNVVE